MIKYEQKLLFQIGQMLKPKREIKGLDNFILLTAGINNFKIKRKRFWLKNDKNETNLKEPIYRSKKMQRLNLSVCV